MDAAQQILELAGYESLAEMNVGERATVSVSGLMDLTIEKIGFDRVSVAHYWPQHGDLMSDPEIVFRIEADTWIPVRYTQHPSTHLYDETGLQQIEETVRDWSNRLKQQGFIENARSKS